MPRPAAIREKVCAMTTESNVALYIGSASLMASEVIRLYAAVGWGDEQAYDRTQVRRALERTTFLVYAADRERNLLGFARAFSDDTFHTSLAELVVHPQHQRRGIGRTLLAAVIERYATTAIFLEAVEGQEDFFLRCGFDQKKGMTVLTRRPDSR